MHPLMGRAGRFFSNISPIYFMAFSYVNSPKRLLTILVVIAGAALIEYTVTCKSGDVIGGWAIDPEQLRIGLPA